MLDKGNNADRAANAVPLAIHITGRPVHPQEPIQRDDLLCFRKLAGEGSLSELKTVTGWAIDTRKLTVSLTDDKVTAWCRSIDTILHDNMTTKKEMETLVGQLNHCGYIIPQACHFLHPIRALSRRFSKTMSHLTPKEIRYLHIWKKFITYAGMGISINNIIYRRPSHIRWDDSCPIGIGGISCTGVAYRYHLPRHLQGRVSNNALEFLASMVGCWLDLHHGHLTKQSCVLALTDSSSACGWLHKSNFQSNEQSFHAAVAEQLAAVFLAADSCIYSQHFAGSLNVIADSLSRDHHLSDKTLIPLLQSKYSTQAPDNFTICPLPHTISSWINSRLLEQPEKTPEFPAQMPSSTGRGIDGSNSSPLLNCNTTNSWTPSTPTTASVCSAPSPNASAKDNFPESVRTTWQAARAKMPWIKWLRPFGQTVGATPAMINPTRSMAASASFTAASPKSIHQQNNKRPSPLPSTGTTTTDPQPTNKKR